MVKAYASKFQSLGKSTVFLKLGVVSMLMTIGNKYLMVHYKYPNILMGFQTLAAVIFLFMGKYMGTVKIIPYTSQHMKIFMLPTLAKFLQMYTSMQAFPYVAVATVVVFRNLSTCVIAFLDGVVMREPLSSKQWFAVFLTLLGVCVYAYEDINYSPVGYAWLGSNSAVFCFNSMWNRYFISKSDQTSDGINLIQQVFMLPLIIFWAVFTNEVKIESFDIPVTQLFALEPPVKAILVGTCVGGCIIGSVYAQSYKLFTATQVTVAANVIKFLSVFIGVYIFSTQLSLKQCIGLVISIAAGVWYSTLPKLPKLNKTHV